MTEELPDEVVAAQIIIRQFDDLYKKLGGAVHDVRYLPFTKSAILAAYECVIAYHQYILDEGIKVKSDDVYHTMKLEKTRIKIRDYKGMKSGVFNFQALDICDGSRIEKINMLSNTPGRDIAEAPKLLEVYCKYIDRAREERQFYEEFHELPPD